MQIEDIEADLKYKIEQTRSWLADAEPPTIDGLEARDTPCLATADRLINDPKRKESDGVLFILEFGSRDRRYTAEAEVRISCTSSQTKDKSGIANGPYVAVYVLEIESGKSLLSFFEPFDNADAYFRSADDSIQDWYAKWLRRLLRLQTGNTVFKHMEPI